MKEEACVKRIQLFKCPRNNDGTQGLMVFKIYDTIYSGEPGTISERIEQQIVPELVGVTFDESLIRCFYEEPVSSEYDGALSVVKATEVFEDDTAEGLVQEIARHMQCCYQFRDNMFWSFDELTGLENDCSLVILVEVARVFASMNYREANEKLREAMKKETEDGMDQESYDDNDGDDVHVTSIEEDDSKKQCLVNCRDHGDDDKYDVIHDDERNRVSESCSMHMDDDNNQDMVHEDDINSVSDEEFTSMHMDDDYDSDDAYIQSFIDDEVMKHNDHVDYVKKWNGVPLDDKKFEMVEVKPLLKIEKMELEMIRYGVCRPIFENNTLKHDKCSICLEGFSYVIIGTRKFMLLEDPNAIVRLSCGHVFHHTCICKWILKMSSCPLCRSSTSVYVPGV